MKAKTYFPITILTVMLAFCLQGFSQETADGVIKKAMKDELTRNMENLKLENLKSPYYISYTISDAKTLQISATLGAIIISEETPYREHECQVYVGDYSRDNQNFMDMNAMRTSYMAGSAMPLDNDYFGIRRALWLTTDSKYKGAAEAYEAKLSSINNQNIPEEEKNLADFTKTAKIIENLPSRTFEMNKEKWEGVVKDISTIFKNYSSIHSSNVTLYLYNANIYFLNSENIETKYPLTLAALRINASTQADDGEPLSDHVLYFCVTPEDFPSVEVIKDDVNAMAGHLTKLKIAPVFDDSYTGPVMFEGQAVGEVISQRLFSNKSGLLAKRKPIFSDPKMLFFMGQLMGKSLEDKIDKKIAGKTFTVKAVSTQEEFKGTKLIGSYKIDAEGVKPPEELVLIENGILKTLLNGRTPTPKIAGSNGHKRLALGPDGGVSADIGPGVIQVSAGKGTSPDKLKKELIKKAKQNELEYAILIKKIQSPASGADKGIDQNSIASFAAGMGKEGVITKPVGVYKVYVEDGREELVRSAELGSVSLDAFKNLLNCSDKQMAYNTMLAQDAGGFGAFIFIFSSMGGDSWSLAGIPASFIVPDALLFEEIEILQERRAVTMKPPVVENPVGKK